jgi:quercetin dioxygenase-like cupin family protein
MMVTSRFNADGHSSDSTSNDRESGLRRALCQHDGRRKERGKMSTSKATTMSNTGMSGQWRAQFTAATILFAAALHPARANAQQGGAPMNLQHAQQVQPAVEGGEKAFQERNATPLMSKPLPDFPAKEVLMLTVTYPPGGSDPVHRHNAHGFIYVLEGSIVMGVKGGEPVTLTPGQTFYEGPDVHTVSRNASKTKPAKFLVFLLKDKDAPVLVPVK